MIFGAKEWRGIKGNPTEDLTEIIQGKLKLVIIFLISMTSLSHKILVELWAPGVINFIAANGGKGYFIEFSGRDMMNILSFLVTILTAVIGIMFWYVKAEKRKYGIERDLNHLKLNQQEISRNILDLTDGLDTRIERLEKSMVEIKALISR